MSRSVSVVPSLVLALHSPHRSIREVTLTCLSALLKVSRESTDNMYTVLVKKLVASTEELTADQDHLPQVTKFFLMIHFNDVISCDIIGRIISIELFASELLVRYPLDKECCSIIGSSLMFLFTLKSV